MTPRVPRLVPVARIPILVGAACATLALVATLGCKREPKTLSGPVSIATGAQGATAPAGDPAAGGAAGGATGVGGTPGSGGPDAARAADLLAGEFAPTPSGLFRRDVEPGTEGAPVLEKGGIATFTYELYLEDGTFVDASETNGQPITLRNVGDDKITPFLNETLVGMREGARRRLKLPVETFFGAHDRPAIVGKDPKRGLVFDVRLTGVQATPEPMTCPDLAKLQLMKSETGLQWTDLVVGKGAEVAKGDGVQVDYTGWLKGCKKFDSSIDSGQPLAIENLGWANVVAGWNEGLVGIRNGGRRVLVIPPELGYAEKGHAPQVPPNATLIFVVDAVGVRRTIPPPTPTPTPTGAN